MENNFISNNLIIYPNPVTINLELQLKNSLEFKHAIIYNSNGKKLLESKKASINVSNLETGIYYVLIETNQGKGVKKIIKE